MQHDRSTKKGASAEGIEQILAERERLEKILEDRYVKEVTILFSDICSYTQYIDRHGDLSGRSMLYKHNQVVLPAIQKHDGLVIEVIGDGVMSAYFDPIKAIFAAIEIQQQLAFHNAGVDGKEAIHVKIGIHVGRVLVDENAPHQRLSGNVANLAARIQEKAKKDQILISSRLYEKVCGSEDFLCRYHGTAELKGKSEPQKMYRVVWQDEELLSPEAARLRTYQDTAAAEEPGSQRVFHLELGRENEKLLISAHEGSRGESLTIRDYETTDISMKRIDSRCKELVESLNRANRMGKVTREVFLKLREIGQLLYDDVFSSNIKERLRQTNALFLSLNLDESLIHIPWELLNDGHRFLCERFAVGRIVRTRRPLSANQERKLARPLRLMILADPTGDLKGAYQEGTRIRDALDHRVEYFNVSLRSDAINVESIRKKLRNFDIVHYAGHADHKSGRPDQSGWRLSDGFFTTRDIDKMAGTAAMPALIFSNSCQSARTENTLLTADFQNAIFGMANSFLLSGVKHYLGTFWEIMDEPSAHFAMKFYEHLANRKSIGEAVKLARQSLIQQYGENNIVWASYLLYGDPTYNYIHQLAPPEAQASAGEEPELAAGGIVRTREEIIDFGKSESGTTGRKRKAAVFAVLSVLLILAAGFLFWNRTDPTDQEQLALAAFRSGNYAQAEEICRRLQLEFPDRPASHLIMGDLHYFRNRPDVANTHYQQALHTKAGVPEEVAQALMGLGRISSLQGKTNDALNYYEKAVERVPGHSGALVSKAVLLAEKGDYEQSIALFRRASENAGSDFLLHAAINETKRRWQWERDREHRQRIDQLVAELSARIEDAGAGPAMKEWSSARLTTWLMDFEVHGPVMQEGAGFLLHSALMEKMLESSRIHVVERELMNELMAELKIGSGKLADKDTALALGRIAAAKVILSGRLYSHGPSQQVILRAIETETGEIFASVNQQFEPSVAMSESVQSLSRTLFEKLFEKFPLRGKISTIEGKIASIDIGARQGVEVGQLFKAMDSSVLLRIQSVEPNQSHAVVEENGSTPLPGLKVVLVSNTPS